MPDDGHRPSGDETAGTPRAREGDRRPSDGAREEEAGRIRVLVVEDDAVQSDFVSSVLSAHPRIDVVGVARTLESGRRLFDLEDPQVILVDLGLPDGRGTDLIRHVAARAGARCDAVVVTFHTDDDAVFESLTAGASGFIAKDASGSDLARVVLDVHAGGSPITPSIARRVLRRLIPLGGGGRTPDGAIDGQVRPTDAPSPESAVSVLSDREKEVLDLSAKGLTYDEIAGVLEVSVNTVRTYVKRVYRKLAVRSRSEAVFEARHLGLL
ncbi:MAG: hypothetical protein RJA99_4534 [Pseudomonadota bacterium]